MFEAFRCALDCLPRAVAVLRESDWTILYANPLCERMYGSSAGPGGLVGKPFKASQARSGEEDFQRVISSQFSAGVEVAVYRSERLPNGAAVSVEVSIKRSHDPRHGKLWICTVEDVTERVRITGALARANRDLRSTQLAKETALRASQARWAAFTNSGVIGVVVASIARNEIIEVNDACARMLGYSRDEYVSGQIDFVQLTPPEWMSVTREARDQLEQRGYTEPYRKELLHKSGVRVPVLIAAVNVNEEESLGLLIDLSAQQSAEDALRATEAQLRQAQKLEAIGRLAGGVAHDFNNILSVILGYAALLKARSSRDQDGHAEMNEIYEAASRGAELTKQLLLFSRKHVCETRLVDLNEVIVRIGTFLTRLVGEDVTLETSLEEALPRVRINPAHVEQILMNLAVNARDAMPKGGTIRIVTSHVVESAADGASEAADRVVLRVIDTGVGMDAATVSRIFEPFFTTKEAGKGSGLGLSTVFGIVQQAQGSISVESSVAQGTTVIIAFPAARDVSDEAPRRESQPPPANQAATILVIEDAAPVRRVASAILRDGGYRVIEVSDPKDAIATFERNATAVDLVLTDLVMPGMNGMELIRELKGRAQWLRVLCMSGYSEDETIARGILELRVPFLVKPFTARSLLERVREVLDSAEAGEHHSATVPSVAKAPFEGVDETASLTRTR